jgi:hypothetical protein
VIVSGPLSNLPYSNSLGGTVAESQKPNFVVPEEAATCGYSGPFEWVNPDPPAAYWAQVVCARPACENNY